MPKVSVIVPIYNVEKYIERCVRSLMEQTLEDIEFIFVDDCSPDNSIAIVNNVLKEYPNRNSKVLYNTSNKGPSYTRARGYYESTGDFIIYCDSDDWVDNNMYEEMYNLAISENADVVVCDISLHYNKDEEPNHYSITKWSNNNIKSLKKHITSDWIHQACHLISRKVYRKMLQDDSNALEHTAIIGIKYQEDLNLLIRQLYFAEKVTTQPKPFYHYDRTNQGSICNSGTSDFYSQQSRLAVNDLIDFFKKHDAYNLYARELNWRILDNLRPLFEEGRWCEFKEINPDKRKHILSCPWVGKYSKIMM